MTAPPEISPGLSGPAFLKIVIVLMITRNAIGVQQVPPSMAINGIALAATLFIMAPVGYEIAESVKVSPLDMSNVQTFLDTGNEAIKPLRAFMLRNVAPTAQPPATCPA